MDNELRPLSLGELLDRSFFLYRKNFVLFAGIMAVPYLALLAFQLAGVSMRTFHSSVAIGAGLGWTLVTWVVTLGVTAASQGATVIAVSSVHLGRRTSIAESFAGIKGRIFFLALIMIGQGIGVVVGLVLLIIPGIILATMWALTIPVAVLEDTGLRDSLERSQELTKGSRGRVFVVYLLFLVLVWIFTIAIQFPLVIAMGISVRAHPHAGVPFWYLLSSPIGVFISQCLAGPLMTIGLSLLYYDQRVRKEGFDLQHMMETLETAAPAAAPASA